MLDQPLADSTEPGRGPTPREGAWRRFHRRRAIARVPLKVGVFLLVVALTLYPKIWLLPTWIGRMQNMNAMIEPAHPGLAGMEAEARRDLGSSTPAPQKALKVVQKIVYAHIPYAWDWDTWGVMDYLPTVGETLALGREDCDGRAVVAASLLQRLGYKAWLVSDFKHTWVATDYGETMSPGSEHKSLVATSQGTETVLTADTGVNLLRGVAFGMGVFPLPRELIILAAAALLALHPRSRGMAWTVGLVVLLAALFTFRQSAEYVRSDPSREALLQWIAVGATLVGAIGLFIRRRGAVAQKRRSAS
jgi:hypothetical protein